jgi:hypothetical protein
VQVSVTVRCTHALNPTNVCGCKYYIEVVTCVGVPDLKLPIPDRNRHVPDRYVSLPISRNIAFVFPSGFPVPAPVPGRKYGCRNG